MICQRCLRRLARKNPSTTTQQRAAFSQLSPRQSSTTQSGANPRPDGHPAATSTPGVTQPFSTPHMPRAARHDVPRQTKAATKLPASSVTAGTVLKGLNFMKNKPDPVALEDHEYPAWLWTALEKKAGTADAAGAGSEGDLFSKSKKQRQRAAKALRKQELLNPGSLAPKIPLYEQSIDLPGGDGTLKGAEKAGEAREELTKAMRDHRRSKIKEDNFLRAMR